MPGNPLLPQLPTLRLKFFLSRGLETAGFTDPACSLAGFQMQNPLLRPFVFRKKTPELLSCTTLRSTACCLVAWPPIPEIVVFGFVV